MRELHLTEGLLRKIWKERRLFYGHDEDQGAFVSVFVKKLYGKKAERSRFVEIFGRVVISGEV